MPQTGRSIISTPIMAAVVSPPCTCIFSHSTLSPVRVRVSLSVSSCARRNFACMSISAGDANLVPSGAGDIYGNSEASSDVLVQYVVLRRDLIDTWPMGSVVTQGCHASVAAIWSHRDDSHTVDYCSPTNLDFMHKVTLEVKGEPQILNLAAKLTAGGIANKLWIEQPENIATCLATKPYLKSIVSPFFRKLKLCK